MAAHLNTVTAIREAFWAEFPEFAQFFRKSKRQNQYNADIRVSFVEFVDSLQRDGKITRSVASRATL